MVRNQTLSLLELWPAMNYWHCALIHHTTVNSPQKRRATLRPTHSKWYCLNQTVTLPRLSPHTAEFCWTRALCVPHRSTATPQRKQTINSWDVPPGHLCQLPTPLCFLLGELGTAVLSNGLRPASAHPTPSGSLGTVTYRQPPCTAEHLGLLSAATIRTRVGWAAIRVACVDVTFVYLLLVESSIGAHALKPFMCYRV